MPYTVVWTRTALDSLATLWLESHRRNAITIAQHIIDQMLRHEPESKGVEFYGDRLLVVPPLQIIYSINNLDMQVVVLAVW